MVWMSACRGKTEPVVLEVHQDRLIIPRDIYPKNAIWNLGILYNWDNILVYMAQKERRVPLRTAEQNSVVYSGRY